MEIVHHALIAPKNIYREGNLFNATHTGKSETAYECSGQVESVIHEK